MKKLKAAGHSKSCSGTKCAKDCGFKAAQSLTTGTKVTTHNVLLVAHSHCT
jgi:hypothetical protein